jgi:catechol 2,3-dioxygenase-like lactoylglutathione lyase family enzyme
MTNPSGVTNPLAPTAVGRFDTVVLDCPDPRALAEFYAGLLGQEIADGGDDSWQSLCGDGSGITLAFQRATGYVAPQWPDGPPQQLHLDLTVDDFVTAHGKAIALGATALSPTDPPDAEVTSGFRVYADPVGHPFCLCR